MAREAKFLVVTKWYSHYGYWRYDEQVHLTTKTGKLAKFYDEKSDINACKENNGIGIAPLFPEHKGLQQIGNVIIV